MGEALASVPAPKKGTTQDHRVVAFITEWQGNVNTELSPFPKYEFIAPRKKKDKKESTHVDLV
jgi:hypothetical protein